MFACWFAQCIQVAQLAFVFRGSHSIHIYRFSVSVGGVEIRVFIWHHLDLEPINCILFFKIDNTTGGILGKN